MKNQGTILIVGGAGFIGSYVNKLLNDKGYQTIVYDNLSRGNRATVFQGEFIQGDMGDFAHLDSVFKSHPIQAVMHFAAFIDVGESVLEPAKYYENNVIKTLNLLNVMLKYEVKTFIFSSSAAIFGAPQMEYISEQHPCNPINPYGETKWMVEKILRDFDHAYGMKSCCLRYFNAAGGDPTGQIKNYQTQPTNLIPLALRAMGLNRPLTIFGNDYPTRDGTCVRDYIHIHDLGTAHLLGMERLFAGSPSLAYNLGNGEGYTVKEVISTIERITGHPIIVQEGKRRPGDPSVLLADATLIRRELGWDPVYPNLDTMIEHAWKALNVA